MKFVRSISKTLYTYRIVIPIKIIRKLNLKQGDEIVISLEENEVITLKKSPG